MLNQMRSGAGNIAAKILLALLILSFALWGVGDMIAHPSSNANLATVDGTAISAQSYAATLARENERIKQSMGTNYSPELLAGMNIPGMVLERQINRALLRQETQDLGLFPSDLDITARIAKTPAFQQNGRFSKPAFLDTLRRNNMSESMFVEQLRQDMAINLLLQSMASLPPVPEIAVRVIDAALAEQRSATLYTLPVASLPVAAPEEADLATYHKDHASEFSEHEYRDISYIVIHPADLSKNHKVSDDDLRKAYNERIDEFKRPEHRQIEQLLYASEDEAKKAADMLDAGKSAADVAKATDALNKKAVSLGDKAESDIIDEAASAVFALKEGEHTAPIKSSFGWHLFRVGKIMDGSTIPFDEARARLEKDAEHDTGDNAINDLSNQLTDALAGGNSMQEAAKELGLSVQTIGSIDATGTTKDGSAKTLPELDNFLPTAFKLDDKGASGLLTSKGNVYYMLHVDRVIPSRVKALDEVKSAVIDGWKKEMRNQKAGELAVELASKLKDTSTRSAIVNEYNLHVSSLAPVKQDAKTDAAPCAAHCRFIYAQSGRSYRRACE